MGPCGGIRPLPGTPGGTLMAVDEAKPGASAMAPPVLSQQALSQQAGTRAGVSAAGGVLALPGARLVYEVTGDGPAVVLVHGFGLDMRMWDPQARALAGPFPLVRYDCRGFGASGPFDPAVLYTHAGDLVALLDHIGVGDAALVGLSFGGRVVLETALAAPARARGLVLLDAVLDGVPWDPESATAIDEVARQVQAARGRGRRAREPGHPPSAP